MGKKMAASNFKVLIFSATAANGYRHASIPAGVAALRNLPQAFPDCPFSTEATEDASVFTTESLARFAVIVLLQTAGDFLTTEQLGALQAFVRSGGGVVSIHCASTGMPSDQSGWYSRLVGAAFDMHPVPQQGLVRVADAQHPIIARSLGTGAGMQRNGDGKWEWDWFDEWYNFKARPSSTVNVLLEVDEASYSGGTHGKDHPIAWSQEFEGGRSFYTALGHFDAAYQDPGFMGQLRDAILWTARVLE